MLHSDNPIFRMDEGTVTLIRLVAPVKSAYDAMASMMLMPIIDVNLAYGDGRQWRPVAELHIAYKSCFAVEGDSNDPISVRAELRLSGCEPVVLMWKVVCSAGALLPWDPSLAPSPTVADL